MIFNGKVIDKYDSRFNRLLNIKQLYKIYLTLDDNGRNELEKYGLIECLVNNLYLFRVV